MRIHLRDVCLKQPRHRVWGGLGGSVWSSDLDRAAGIAAKLECGTAWVNSHGGIAPNIPFGGVKCSGIGVEFGEEGLQEYTTIQVVNISKAAA